MGNEGKGCTAREYLRVSRDKSGRERSIDEQHTDNQRVADEHGWHLGDPYRDTGSASRYATNGRAGFDTLTADLKADRFGADVLILWESSRGSRKVGEWVELIEACEAQSVKIAVTSHARVYDPANARDRRSLIEDATDSEYETAKLSVRSRRAAAAGAAAGAPHGRTPFGYQRTYDPATGRLAGQEVNEPEAAVVRELFDRIIEGHSFRAIANDLADRGITKRSGTPFSPAHLRDLCTKDLYRGKRVHAPGRMLNSQRLERATVVDATWSPIVSEATWLAVHRIITDPTRLTNRPGRGKHLLSMIARCDPCGGPLTVAYKHQGARYYCRDKGCAKVDKAELDAFAEAAILGYLARPDNVERLTAPDDAGPELVKVRDEIAEVRAELDDLADQLGRGTLSATLAARAEPAIRRRLEAAEAREAELSTPPRLRALIKPGADVARRWKAAPVSARREIARILLSPEILGELRVARSPTPGRPVPAVERVVWRT